MLPAGMLHKHQKGGALSYILGLRRIEADAHQPEDRVHLTPARKYGRRRREAGQGGIRTMTGTSHHLAPRITGVLTNSGAGHLGGAAVLPVPRVGL